MLILREFLLAITCIYSFNVALEPSVAQEGHVLKSGQPDSLRLNQIQVIGSHNSFKTAIEPNLYRLLVKSRPDAQELDYAHPSLSDQLNLGLRGLEIDVFYDPQGGQYAKPLGLEIVRKSGGDPLPYDPEGKMREPGFKVLHIQDIDFRSNCLTLVDALTELRTWSHQHPRHLPVIITLNLSDNPIELPGSVAPVRFDRAAYDSLDQQFLSTLGRDKLVLPDNVRGDHETLGAAVRNSGWPTLAETRGRFLLVLDDAGRKREEYLADHPALVGRVMFTNSEPGQPEAAVMIRNQPLIDGEKISQLVQQGYLIRTRADSGTIEARNGDYSRFEAAKKSGAQVISTDYYLADWRLNSSYSIRFDQGRCSRLNPITYQDQSDLPESSIPLHP
ncbi:MAG: phosphatidylinositol-specific phospholipase C1-like protein [Aeoliella sp.]